MPHTNAWRARRAGLWAALAVISFSLAYGLERANIPAAMFLGPMLTGLVFAVSGADLVMPRWTFAAAQSVVGSMVAVTITASTLATLIQNWPAMLTAVALVVTFGGLVGFGLMRYGGLPGTTAAWGTSPGGAAAMTAMAEAFGADMRMVAFMQYMRLLVVVSSAAGVSRLLLGGHAVAALPPGLAAGVAAPPLALAQTLGLIAAGVVLGRVSRLPAGSLVVPMLGGAALHAAGLIDIVLPPWLLFSAYALLGWFIGLRFTPQTVRHALRAAPRILCGILSLMLLCSSIAWLLVKWMHVDPLSAYLATSPGGLDSMAIIAVGSGCNVPFVLALQSLRLFTVVLTGPLVARLVCRLSESKPIRGKDTD
ncbi:MAG: AbrB family transcriptional regulator [Desulfovibrionaceae bacterium CG1_02_65_16]|nr:MAG: AbrB family transcriptional regulator [Desulfovibrionaceae bacterium CG1_02_65_16]